MTKRDTLYLVGVGFSIFRAFKKLGTRVKMGFVNQNQSSDILPLKINKLGQRNEEIRTRSKSCHRYTTCFVFALFGWGTLSLQIHFGKFMLAQCVSVATALHKHVTKLLVRNRVSCYSCQLLQQLFLVHKLIWRVNVFQTRCAVCLKPERCLETTAINRDESMNFGQHFGV